MSAEKFPLNAAIVVRVTENPRLIVGNARPRTGRRARADALIAGQIKTVEDARNYGFEWSHLRNDIRAGIIDIIIPD